MNKFKYRRLNIHTDYSLYAKLCIIQMCFEYSTEISFVNMRRFNNGPLIKLKY